MGAAGRIAGGLGGAAAAIGGGLALYAALQGRRARRLVPADGRFLDVGGARVHYVDVGQGPAIVMIHGLGGQLRHFSYALIERLSADHRVIAIDRPGSGYSTIALGTAHTLASQAKAVAGTIRALGLERPLLVGHSLGGALALAVALAEPGLVGGLALICPLTQPVEGTPRVFKALIVPSSRRRRLIAWTLAVPLGQIGQAKARHVIFAPDPVPADFGTRGGGALIAQPAAFYTASTEVSAGTRDLAAMAARYGEIDLPVGILFARGDRILPPALHGETTAAAIPNAELEMIDGGHMIPLTAPDAVAAFVRRQAARIPTPEA